MKTTTSSSRAGTGDPTRILLFTLLFTAGAVIVGIWSAYDSYQRLEGTVQRNAEIQSLRGRIVFLDEVLTMSARMSVATGDLAWEARYQAGAAELDDALATALELADGVGTTRRTDDANLVLVALERKAFELVAEGRLADANELLTGEEYVRQKKVYAEGMEALGANFEAAAASAMEVQRGRIFAQLLGGVVVIVLLVITWIVVIRAFHNWLRAREALDNIERDLDIAREIQRGLLPKEKPDVAGFDVAGWSRAADKTGGDYFDWMPLPDGRLLVVIADVSGHGVGPAMIAAVCRAYIRGASSGVSEGLAGAVERVNEMLHLDIPSNRFVTAAVGVLTPATHEMELVSVGQAPMLYRRASTGEVENWPADDVPFAVTSGMSLDEVRRIHFEPGDALVLTTDGFFEWPDPTGDQYGVERLVRLVARSGGGSPESLVETLQQDVLGHAAGVEQPDDVTVVVVRREPS